MFTMLLMIWSYGSSESETSSREALGDCTNCLVGFSCEDLGYGQSGLLWDLLPQLKQRPSVGLSDSWAKPQVAPFLHPVPFEKNVHFFFPFSTPFGSSR